VRRADGEYTSMHTSGVCCVSGCAGRGGTNEARDPCSSVADPSLVDVLIADSKPALVAIDLEGGLPCTNTRTSRSSPATRYAHVATRVPPGPRSLIDSGFCCPALRSAVPSAVRGSRASETASGGAPLCSLETKLDPVFTASPLRDAMAATARSMPRRIS